jgi:teichuronic acid exporter
MTTINEPAVNLIEEQMVPPAKTDKALIKSGVIWTALQMLINQSFAFIVKLILIKLLLPSQFGLVGMATVFTGLVQVINDIGVGAALIQRKEADLTETHYHTAFWTGVAWSITLFVIIGAGVGPLAADFYNQPYLEFIIPVISIGILCSPVNLVHKAQLTRQMNFKKIAIIDNTSNIVAGCIAIVLALCGAGIWALVFNTIAAVVIAMPLYYNATKWLPKFHWGKQAFRDIFGFGAYTAGANVFTYFYNNIDYLLIGKLLGASTLGIYTFAFVITDTFRSRIVAVINNVMYPVYGKKQSEPVALKRYYLKVVQINCLLVFPIMLFLVLLGAQFVIYIFGAKWQGAIIPLQILSVSVMFQMMVSGNTALIRGLGKPGLDMKLQIFKAAVFVPTLAYATIYYGILGASIAVLFNKFLLVVIAQFTFNFLLPVKISTAELLKALYPCVAASVATTIVYLIGNAIGMHFLFLGVLLFASYGVVVWFMIGHQLKLLLKKNS